MTVCRNPPSPFFLLPVSKYPLGLSREHFLLNPLYGTGENAVRMAFQFLCSSFHLPFVLIHSSFPLRFLFLSSSLLLPSLFNSSSFPLPFLFCSSSLPLPRLLLSSSFHPSSCFPLASSSFPLPFFFLACSFPLPVLFLSSSLPLIMKQGAAPDKIQQFGIPEACKS